MVKTAEIVRLVDACSRRDRNGVVTTVHKGAVPSRDQSVATYLAQDVVSPSISVRRLDRYDGQQVTYHDCSHTTERVARETVDVFIFIGRMGQHVFPQGFKRVRYDGVQATKTFAKIKRMMHDALAQGQGMVKGAIKRMAAQSYREHYQTSTGRDPLICPHGKAEMGIWKRWHQTYGVLDDELEAMREGCVAGGTSRPRRKT